MNSLPLKIFLFIAFACTFCGAGNAQDGPPPDRPERLEQRPVDDRVKLLVQLGLTRAQIQRFQRTNNQHRPMLQAAQRRFREANRDLDLAIYADNLSESEFETKLAELQKAQVELNRIRFLNELAIRKLLTPEQLIRFREMRRRFAENRDRIQQPRQGPPNDSRQIKNDQPQRQTSPLRQMNPRNRP